MVWSQPPIKVAAKTPNNASWEPRVTNFLHCTESRSKLILEKNKDSSAPDVSETPIIMML